ncbi:hypothetical protein [Desertibacillus haloalkaliphilus]|uniref:hypothetical protein n=1 Tax=Desertibacillus haloalkaliphilus TaxID=1328930 RepID=UPI001C254A40|nr:hypothetical protein [Desertibacillus haloalkaliphilus]MBU8907583.1 hypothetical protein [Desertibacillus haloalkaliphilus]
MEQHQEYQQYENHDDRHDHHKAHNQQMHDTCTHYHLYFVQLQTTDGQTFEGIIEDIDNDGVTMLMPAGETREAEDDIDERQFGVVGVGAGFPGVGVGFGFPGYGFPGYGYPGFGWFPGYGAFPGYGGFPWYGYPRRFRRFRRRRFPFYGIGGVFPFY